MVTGDSSAARARLSIKFYLERLRAQTAELSAQSYPGNLPGPRLWLALINGLLDTADALLAPSEDPGSCTTPEDRSREAISLASLAYECLYLMKGAGIDDLPYPVARPLQRWFDQLNVHNTTLFRSETIANYELRRIEQHVFKDIHDSSSTLSSAIDSGITWPLLRVTVPGKALGILPHFAIVAHEIGHALHDRIPWDRSIVDADQSALKDRIAERLHSNALTDKAARHMQEIFDRWFEEFVADAFGLLLAGPAFFFSLSDFLQLEGRGLGFSESHPPHDLRRRLLFKRLSAGDRSFASIFASETGAELSAEFNSSLLMTMPTKDEVFLHLKDYDEELAAVLAELPESFAKLHDAIYDQVSAYLQANAPRAVYGIDTYERDLAIHLDALLAAIPPIENGISLEERRPSEFASILNVGWAVMLTRLKDLRVKTADDPLGSEKLERLHGLLLKAVELAEARRDWEAASGGTDGR